MTTGSDPKYAISMEEWENSIICTGQRQWYPDPSKLRCADACEEVRSS